MFVVNLFFFSSLIFRNRSSWFHFWSSHCPSNRSKVCTLEETEEVAWYTLNLILFFFPLHYTMLIVTFNETLCHYVCFLPLPINFECSTRLVFHNFFIKTPQLILSLFHGFTLLHSITYANVQFICDNGSQGCSLFVFQSSIVKCALINLFQTKNILTNAQNLIYSLCPCLGKCVFRLNGLKNSDTDTYLLIYREFIVKRLC